MRQPSYRERDYAFGQMVLLLRMSLELTQVELAEILDISRKAVGRWEAGAMYPKPPHLKALLAFALDQHAFTSGHAEEEIRAFWQAAHQKTPLDERWLHELFEFQQAQLALTSQGDVELAQKGNAIVPLPVRGTPRVDWGDALDVPEFYGREEEAARLSEWVVQERCRLVCILGMGGIGKSALTVRFMHSVASHFDVVIWRSMRDAPACEKLLDEYLHILVPKVLPEISTGLERRLHLLLEALRDTRVLLVLDNLETLLEEGQSVGHMRPGYEDYTHLLQRLAETDHQSCLLLTGREKPSVLAPYEGSRETVRSLRLPQLDANSCQRLLVEKDVTGSAADYDRLITAYAGNPLALKIVSQTIVDLFDGEIAPFLAQGEVVFGGVRALLSEQYARLTDTERMLLRWLAILRESVSIKELLAVVGVPVSRTEALEAIDGLWRRSLLERGQLRGSFTLQSVVLEYITGQFITEVTDEIREGKLVRLTEHGLELAMGKDYVRQAQRRLIVIPILANLRHAHPARSALDRHLLSLLNHLRDWADYAQGYGPANLLALLREQRGHLRGLDLSQLTIRSAYLRGIEMQDTSLLHATLRDTVFNEAFDVLWSVAISCHGQYWAAGSGRGEVRVWREAGKLLHLAWQAHTETVRSLAFSPDERMLATGSWDGSIKLWDIEAGALIWMAWFTDNIECLAFAPDGRTLASAGDDGTVQLWDAHTGEHHLTLSDQGGPLFALAWSPDGRQLASGGIDGRIRLWELTGTQSKTLARMLIGHTDWVVGLAFTSDGTHLASGSWDGTVRVWDVESLRLRQTLTGHIDRVRAVAWSPNGQLLASCGFDQTIWLWDVERGNYRTGLYGHTAGIYDLAFTPDGANLLSSSEDGTLRVWDVERGQCVHIMQGYAVSLYDVAWSPDGTQLASAGSDTQITIWKMESLSTPQLLHGHRSLVFGVDWSPDGKILASSGWDNTVRLWDVSTGEVQQNLHDPDHMNNLFFGIAWSPDGRRLAAASYQHGVQVWEPATGTPRWVSYAQSTRIRCVAWNSDGSCLVSCGDDSSVFIWDASDGALRASLHGHSGMVMAVAWSLDGTRLASGGRGRGGGEVIIWDAQSYEPLRSWRVPDSIVYALAWSSIDELLLGGGSDGMLRWWDTRCGECVRVLQGHQGTIHSLKVHPDGKTLASSGDDNAIRLWDLQEYRQIQTLRRDRPYERLNIRSVKGVTKVQKENLRVLGAIE